MLQKNYTDYLQLQDTTKSFKTVFLNYNFLIKLSLNLFIVAFISVFFEFRDFSIIITFLIAISKMPISQIARLFRSTRKYMTPK